MPKEHGTAAIALKSKLIKKFFSVFAFGKPFLVFFPEMPNRLPAAPASYRYNHLQSPVALLSFGAWLGIIWFGRFVLPHICDQKMPVIFKVNISHLVAFRMVGDGSCDRKACCLCLA